MAVGNEMAIRHELGIDVYYYLLHRDGQLIVNMMNIQYKGVGLFGHVFTKLEERWKGGANALMEDFRQRGGKALYLGTGYVRFPTISTRRTALSG